MSRYMEAINLLIKLRQLVEEEHPAYGGEIYRVLAIPESPGEQAIREGDEMMEEALRMSGGL